MDILKEYVNDKHQIIDRGMREKPANTPIIHSVY
jgi:hypothetical protein